MWSAPLSLSPLTTDRELALRWFEDLADAGLGGLILKGEAQPYVGGKRIWLKYKRVHETDIVCGAVIGPIDRPTEIVAGLPIEANCGSWAGLRFWVLRTADPWHDGSGRRLAPILGLKW